MSAARHYRPGPHDLSQVRKEVEADISSARRAQRNLQAAGSHGVAERMRKDTDEYLDELAALDAGTWKPKHA